MLRDARCEVRGEVKAEGMGQRARRRGHRAEGIEHSVTMVRIKSTNQKFNPMLHALCLIVFGTLAFDHVNEKI